MALSDYFICKQLRDLISEIKEGKPEEELIIKYSLLILDKENERRYDKIWQVLMEMYDYDAEKLKGDIALNNLLNSWGGNKRNALAVVYPAIMEVTRNFDLIKKFEQSEELLTRELRIYDNSELPIL